MILRSLISALVLAGSLTGAQAAVVNVTGTASGDSFTRFPTATGAHGLELRAGKSGTRGDWELGLGTATSTSGQFSQGQWDWGSYQNPTLYNFELIYSGYGTVAPGNAEFRIWSMGTAKPSGATLVWNSGGLLTGNAVAIASKGLAGFTLTEIDGMAVNETLSTTTGQQKELVFYAPELADGFNVVGTLQIDPQYFKVSGNNPGPRDAGSRNEIFIKAGTVTAPAPVPLPAALPLLLAGLGGLALAARRRR